MTREARETEGPRGGDRFGNHGPTQGAAVEEAGKIATWTLLSRVLGLARDVLIIAALGIGADVFFMAFRLPNIMRRMTAEGVLGMAHSVNLGQKFPSLGMAGLSSDPSPDSLARDVPGGRVSQATGTAGQDAFLHVSAIRYSAGVALKYGLLTALLATVLAIFAPECIRLVAPGFDATCLQETARLFRWCLLYLPLSAGTAVLAATLISCRKAGPAAFAPLLLNIGIISFGLGAFVTGSAAFFAAGVVAGGVLQLVWLVSVLYGLYRPAVRAKGLFSSTAGIKRGWFDGNIFPADVSRRIIVYWRRGLVPGVKKIAGMTRLLKGPLPLRGDYWRYRLKCWGHMAMTVVVGSSGYLYFFMSSVGASFFSSGSVSAIYMAERLIEFPLAIVGSSLAMAFMPQYSVLAKDKTALGHALEKSLRLCCFVIFPATVGIVTLHFPIVRMLFGHGAMGHETLLISAEVFAIMGCALPALCLSRQLMGALVALDGAGRFQAKKGNCIRVMCHTVWGGCLVILGISVLLGPFVGLCAVALGVVLAAWGQCLYLWRLAKREINITGAGVFLRREGRFFGVLGGLAVCLGGFGFWLYGLDSEILSAVLLCFVIGVVGAGWIKGFALWGNDEAKALWAMINNYRPAGRR